MSTLPTDIGPHEGIEFDLMRQGAKHVALFFELEPVGLENALADGFTLLQFHHFTHAGVAYFTRIVFRTGYENQALRLKELVQDPTPGIDAVREHEIGRILSYTPAQVDAFLMHIAR